MKQAPSDNVTICRFCRSGDLSHLRRRFVGLPNEVKRITVRMINDDGEDPAKAITKAKRFYKKYGDGLPLIITEVMK